jgi:hypothetical protein
MPLTVYINPHDSIPLTSPVSSPTNSLAAQWASLGGALGWVRAARDLACTTAARLGTGGSRSSARNGALVWVRVAALVEAGHDQERSRQGGARVGTLLGI